MSATIIFAEWMHRTGGVIRVMRLLAPGRRWAFIWAICLSHLRANRSACLRARHLRYFESRRRILSVLKLISRMVHAATLPASPLRHFMGASPWYATRVGSRFREAAMTTRVFHQVSYIAEQMEAGRAAISSMPIRCG